MTSLPVSRTHAEGGTLVTPTQVLPRQVTPAQAEPGVLDALALAAKFADELLLGAARDTHRAIADRAFGLATVATPGLPVAQVPRVVHDSIATSIYASLSLALRAASAGLFRLGATGVGPRLDASPPGRAVHAAVNGLIGDRLREEHPQLALAMTVREGGRAVPLDPEALAAAYPEASDRLVVFVHGLGEHEASWDLRRYEMGGSYGSRLAAHAGWTPVYLRVNTGLSVAENGIGLTALLQDLVDAWPAQVRRVALVGHSMGGLIIRAACAVATASPRAWTGLVSDVVTLGTPHFGADLARGAKSGAAFLARVPEGAAFGRILDERSPGIRDLERGLPELPPLPHVRYRLVSAAIGGPRSPFGWLLGDLLVRRGSATATRRALQLFPEADLLHVTSSDHFSLLNHPEVFTAMKQWLA